MNHIVGLSGGKDSTAMALRLRELNPGTDYQFVCTPTGNELPEMVAHWEHLGELLGTPVKHIGAPSVAGTNLTLYTLIIEQRSLPNHRMRFCTRMLKILPFQTYVLGQVPCITYVGIRADEAGSREGVTDWGTGVQASFPLIEWGWNLGDVQLYLRQRDVVVPQRTDCALCFFQTLGEWHELYLHHRDIYEQGVVLENLLGHTFRSAKRDSHPASLKELGREFAWGFTPPPRTMQDRTAMCSVCAR